MSRPLNTLWDFAGVDGLPVARALFGDGAARLSAYQSREGGEGCSLLRLCEGNFRARVADPETLADAARGRRVWARPNAMAVLVARDDAPGLLPFASVKPPHRLHGLPPDHAVPARLGDCAVLLWRHGGGLEVHAAARDADAVRACLRRADLL